MNEPSKCRHNNPVNFAMRKIHVQGNTPGDGLANAFECLKCNTIVNVEWANPAVRRAGAFAANATLRKVFGER
jgi:hypothetical protein